MSFQINSNTIFKKYSEHLINRISKGVEDITEDCIRYDFFSCLHQSGYNAHDIFLEYKFKKNITKSIDTVIKSCQEEIALEFKYFRRHPSKKNAAVTIYMSSVICDLIRLQTLPHNGFKRFFVLLTDDEMFKYISNTQEYSALVSDNITTQVKFDTHKEAKTFIDKIKKEMNGIIDITDVPSILLNKVYFKKLPQEHWLIIHEVL